MKTVYKAYLVKNFNIELSIHFLRRDALKYKKEILGLEYEKLRKTIQIIKVKVIEEV
jgi:hypothetical protein